MRMLAATLVLFGLCACERPPASSLASRNIEALSARVQALEDERAVIAVIDALDLAVDAKNWAETRRLFADDIDADFSTLGGAPGRIRADDLVQGWRTNLFVGKPSFHLRGAAHVRLDGDAAFVVANGYAWNLLPQRTENELWEVWGRYEFALTRTPDGWKITGMKFFSQHDRGDRTIRTEVLRQ